MICFYHCDQDGRAAGAIVHKYIQENFSNTEERYHEIQYGEEENILSKVEIKSNEAIYVVDFHFTPEVTKRLLKTTKNIKMFDHHKTTAKLLPNYPEEVECICDPGSEWAGCELVWRYLYPDKAIPEAIILIADRDKWAWKHGEKTAQFTEALKIYPHQPEDQIWTELLSWDSTFERCVSYWSIDKMLEEGKTCLRYRDAMCKDFRDLFGYEVEWLGLRCYVLNLRLSGVGSEAFAEKLDEYDICISTVYTGEYWKISLISNGKVDVSKIAASLGGGGHEKAAGFQCYNFYPFRKRL